MFIIKYTYQLIDLVIIIIIIKREMGIVNTAHVLL